jgi:hypothetical protein
MEGQVRGVLVREDGIVLIDVWERMTDEKRSEFISKVRWFPPLRLVVDNAPVVQEVLSVGQQVSQAG